MDKFKGQFFFSQDINYKNLEKLFIKNPIKNNCHQKLISIFNEIL